MISEDTGGGFRWSWVGYHDPAADYAANLTQLVRLLGCCASGLRTTPRPVPPIARVTLFRKWGIRTPYRRFVSIHFFLPPSSSKPDFATLLFTLPHRLTSLRPPPPEPQTAVHSPRTLETLMRPCG